MDYLQQAKRVLKVYRATHDLSQVEFAAKCGISLRSVAKIETEKRVSDFILNKALDMAGYRLKVTKEVEEKE